MSLSKERVCELFEYRDGQLIRKITVASNGRAGDVAGTLNKDGYIQVSVDKQIYRAHRLIFLMHHGYMPKLVDHKDRDRRNNRIENLRAASSVQNGYNKSMQVTNRSGYKGVSYCKRSGKWQANISVNGKIKFLGRFEFADIAHLAYEMAAAEYHGEFAS